jgi:hypothetical protein
MENSLMASKANYKLANVPSGIAPAKQAWIPIIRSINSSTNSAQLGGSYSLHNSLGQPVAQAALPATSHEQVFNLALPNLPNGFYFLSLHNTQGKMLGSKLLIIMRE